MQGRNATMKHTRVFTHCHKGQLLNIINEDGPNKALAFLESDILLLGDANIDFVNPKSINE